MQEYAQIRIKDCMLKTDFSQQYEGSNREILMRLLNESIVEELKLDTSISTDDIKYELRPGASNPKDFISELKLDPEAKYNLDHINNENGIGFNNLEGRVRGDEAHESVFDKMMA